MKKFLIYTLLMCCSLNLVAQDEISYGWVKELVKGDEMKGTSDSYSYTYTSTEVLMLFKENATKNFVISTVDGIFDYQYVSFVKEYRIGGQAGFYDINDNFIKKESCPFTPGRGGSNIARSRCSDAVGTEIISYLKDSIGYVRFILPRYEKLDLDVKIPCLHNPEDGLKL